MNQRKTEERMRELARKWQEGTISEEEKKKFDQWYNSLDDTAFNDVSSETTEELRERLYRAILDKENIGSKDRSKKWPWLAIAASISLILSLGVYLYSDNSNSETLAAKGSVEHDIAPGTDKALLTLADGSQIVLDSTKNGVLVNEGNVLIHKNAEGQVVYQIKGKGAGAEQMAYNTISTPRGGQYQISLPDGTRVWLNSASSVKFPAAFGSKERRVELNGEAYFEVAHMPKVPFIVQAAGQETRVLGTHFNISAYDDESAITTTLLEGSIQVKHALSGASQVLSPGQQSRVAERIQVAAVDPLQAVAWKNGYFVFENESVQSIMRKISRWYDVDITYTGNIEKKVFGGTISRFENVSTVLKIMELTGVIHFRIEGRRIIVMP